MTMTISQITSPTLLIDKPTVLNNIQRMADKASAHSVTLKPHFKTHQSAEVGEWFQEFGVEAITVSSVQMAHFFADQGWDDMTIAFPVNIREIDAINELADGLERLSIFLLDMETAKLLNQQLTSPVHIYIEIDTGAGRSGFLPEETDEITALIQYLNNSDQLIFTGFYSHPGHSYAARSEEDILEIHEGVLGKMNALKNRFDSAKYCIGDTPCCSVAKEFAGIDEISPGNFVYYDLMQVQIGACSLEDIAVALAAPVVAEYPKRSELILHCGAVHLSKESILWEDRTIYGLPAELTDKGWAPITDGSFVKALSQEHGVLKCSKTLFQKYNPGNLIGILPVHSCLAADLMDRSQILH